ncbi:Bcr/CflA family multidrug efflux MFS transporter [Goodfellowiella coeruleoviolacea]|uniref:MFS transporter, DHA1 family, bicyclomycin/chloramphenicol resistance protein n=1 Tax=Goodfellowiella coeruleoviolacea TaxID=334858 RepID=A0AAE3GD23_9PSEU|nr:Bcr/CflA family multidrug efflux MFS transporter [Goodfellowiella coeruleoviolacea]MCP2164969.1 MFS transporter, DHA1 family, bicyclomycin/chloramphenicol resistance protein [Goodfellowiella coeruleoviolacea]
MSTETITPSRSRTLRFLLILGGLTAFGPLSIDMYLPAFPTIAADFGTGPAQVQLSLTACVIGLAVGQLLAGPLSDSLGRRRPLLIGLAVYCVASLLCAFAPSALTLTGLRLVQGLGAAAGIVIARAVVRDLYSGVAVARFFSTLMLVTGLAPILAPVLGGQLMRLTSWRGVFVALTAIGVLLLVVAVLALPETLPAAQRRPGSLGTTLRTFGQLLVHRGFIGYALAAGLAFAAMFAYISGSSFVLQDVYGLSPQTYSIVFGANALGLVVLGQLNGRLVGRVSTTALLTTGLGMTVVGGVLLLVAAVLGLGLVGILPPLFLLVSSMGMVMPNATTLALAAYPQAAGTASALLGTAQFVVGGVAAPLVGLGGEHTAVPMAAVMAAFGVLGLAAYALLARGSAAALTEDGPSAPTVLAEAAAE